MGVLGTPQQIMKTLIDFLKKPYICIEGWKELFIFSMALGAIRSIIDYFIN